MSSAAADFGEFSPLEFCGAKVPAQAIDADAALMVEVARGSEAAFTALVQRHQDSLLNFFTRMGVSCDGEDLVQETFVRLFRYRARYRPTAPFGGFLYHIARQVWADRGRKIVRLERLTAAYQNELETCGRSAPIPAGEALDTAAALVRLSPKLREVVVLNVCRGLSYQEVAEALGIPLGTVKSRLNLAFAALREMLT
jgi:RNA polymerase sigma-70 factor (ECF subfamily)